MHEIGPEHIESIQNNMDVAQRGMQEAVSHIKQQREQFVRATIDVTDLIVQADNINRVLPDPTLLADRINNLKRTLETLEDLIYNPQDKVEILNAIRSRPHAGSKIIADSLQRFEDGNRAVESLKQELVRERKTVRRDCTIFCAAITLVSIGVVLALH